MIRNGNSDIFQILAKKDCDSYNQTSKKFFVHIATTQKNVILKII